MSGISLMLRMITATISIIAVGATVVFGYIGMIGPFSSAIDGPPDALGWGDLGGTVTTFVVVAMLLLLLIIAIWMIAGPIRSDQRQEFRGR
jgi:hypothetical protein